MVEFLELALLKNVDCPRDDRVALMRLSLLGLIVTNAYSLFCDPECDWLLDLVLLFVVYFFYRASCALSPPPISFENIFSRMSS